MNPSIQVFLQVALLYCVVTTSIGGITDWQKAFSELENRVKVSQEEIKSLHQKIDHLEKRLETLETKGKFCEVQIQSAFPILQLILRNSYRGSIRNYTIKYRIGNSTIVSTVKLISSSSKIIMNEKLDVRGQITRDGH